MAGNIDPGNEDISPPRGRVIGTLYDSNRQDILEIQMLEFLASLRITGKDLDPEEISGLLGLTPTTSHRRGDPHIGKKGRYADYPEGFWALESPVRENKPLKEHLRYLKNQLTGKEQTLADLRSRGYTAEVFIGVFEIGDGDEVGLSRSELNDLAALQVDICFDLYTFNDPDAQNKR